MHTIKLSWEGFLFALFNSIFVRLFERQLQKLALKPMTYLAFLPHCENKLTYT